MTRCGWTRFFAYCFLKKLAGQRVAMCFAPTLYGKLHDEIKIYVGYFRFPVVIALVVARAIVYQEMSFAGLHSPAFNQSAALALLGALSVTGCLVFFRWPRSFKTMPAWKRGYKQKTMQCLSPQINGIQFLASLPPLTQLVWGMLVVECLEDHIVIRQIIPMSPVVEDFIQNDLRKDMRHAAWLGLSGDFLKNLRLPQSFTISTSKTIWY